MQEDMHFYGTYVLARAAGIPREDAHTLAYAAQFVDDADETANKDHPDGGLLFTTATVHSNKDACLNSLIDPMEQRRVWVPFHFLPGGAGDTFEEKLLCVMDSGIANDMVEHHMKKAADGCSFGLELAGITAHVYMDTFSHYGFSGIGSERNLVNGESIEPVGVSNPEMERYILDKKAGFFKKYLPLEVASWFAETASGALGHGAVATFPDRPFLRWRMAYEHSDEQEERDNTSDYLAGCEKMHAYLSEFARDRYEDSAQVSFAGISDAIERILRFEGAKQDRSEQWRAAVREGSIYTADEDEADDLHYDAGIWASQMEEFGNLQSSNESIDGHLYRFHQAAALHRHYVLKELLPAHGIAVY